MRLWKDEILTAVGAWAAERRVPIHEAYSGGLVAAREDRDLDSVEMAGGWLLWLVTRLEKTVPGVEEEEHGEWEQVCLFEKVEGLAGATEVDDNEGMNLDV